MVYETAFTHLGYKVDIHAGCLCNELVSLHNRHLVDRTYIKYKKFDILEQFNMLAKKINIKTQKIGYNEVVNSFSGVKKRAYYNAMINLINNGFNKKHTNVKMFIKADKWPADIISEKAPRAIQFRSKEYNLILASYLKPLEKAMYEGYRVRGRRVIAKGLDQQKRAELLMEKIADFDQPCFVNLDHSKFDSTVNRQHLLGLHKIYRKCCGKGVFPYLKHQLKNNCYTRHGIHYKTQATRCSGDFDTALGNTIINIACIEYVMRGKKYDYILDGDDAVIIMEKNDNFPIERCRDFGFDTKAEIVYTLYGIEFCQSRLVNAPWRFVRNPIRAISNQMVIHKPYGMKLMAQYLAGVGVCELAVSHGVPILQQQGVRLAAHSDIPYYDEDTAWLMQALGTEPQVRQVSAEARRTMEKSWGIPWGTQLAIEHELQPLTLSYVLKRTKYELEPLFATWQRMATVGCSCFTGRWDPG